MNKITLSGWKCGDCKAYSTWTEMHGFRYGSGEQMSECLKEPEIFEAEVAKGDEDWGVKIRCPFWEGIEIFTCPRHGEYRDVCPGCEEEAYEDAKDLGEYFGLTADPDGQTSSAIDTGD